MRMRSFFTTSEVPFEASTELGTLVVINPLGPGCSDRRQGKLGTILSLSGSAQQYEQDRIMPWRFRFLYCGNET